MEKELILAIGENNLEQIMSLVEKGTKINLRHIDEAVKTSNLEVLKYLVESSDSSNFDDTYYYAFNEAITRGKLPLFYFLIDSVDIHKLMITH